MSVTSSKPPLSWYMGFTMQLFTNIGGGIAKSRQGLSLYVMFRKKAPPTHWTLLRYDRKGT